MWRPHSKQHATQGCHRKPIRPHVNSICVPSLLRKAPRGGIRATARRNLRRKKRHLLQFPSFLAAQLGPVAVNAAFRHVSLQSVQECSWLVFSIVFPEHSGSDLPPWKG